MATVPLLDPIQARPGVDRPCAVVVLLEDPGAVALRLPGLNFQRGRRRRTLQVDELWLAPVQDLVRPHVRVRRIVVQPGSVCGQVVVVGLVCGHSECLA